MSNAKTFRLFISSPFNDFRKERQVLHEKVFPKIDKYCIENGYTFQPVDLRWGVSEEAQLDQKTLELCLNEVKACKHYPHPNFLIMTGNRYGWVPLPYAIEKDEFRSIEDFYANNTQALEILNEWYKEDTNHLMLDNASHAYVLRQRDPEGPYRDWQEWEKIENVLRDLLQTAVKERFEKGTAQYDKYFLSATEAEVEEGIFQYLNPTAFQDELKREQTALPELDKEYVFGFTREITNIETLDLSKEPAKLFVDKDQTKAKTFKQELSKAIMEENRLTASVELYTEIDNPFVDESHLEMFETFMITKLKKAIDKQIKESKEVSPLQQERLEQLRFKTLKTDTFFGREDELEAVAAYISSDSYQPFIVHGISGIGKSSFIAKAIDEIEERLSATIIYRFIGATAASSNIRVLLESLIHDLNDQGVLELPESFEEDNNRFNEQIKELLLSITEPTVIILDALDQLQHTDYLRWLPLELPSKLKVVLSMLDQEGYEHYYELLKNKVDDKHKLKINPITKDIATTILDTLLLKENRYLTTTQHQDVLKRLEESNNSPLYLKIAFEEVKMWKESDTDQDLRIGVHEVIKEFIDNLTSRSHHDKAIVHKVLGLISASKDGLSEKEILDLLSREETILKNLEKFNDLTLEIDGEEVRRFPISIWARLSEQLRPFLNQRLIDGQELITFFHRQIDEAVRDYIYIPNSQTLHRELADYFLTLQDKDKLWDKRYFNLHMLDELPYQLFHANDSERLKDILFDLEFAGSIYDHYKQHGFREIMEKTSQLEQITEDEIYPWESFYREKGHLIAKVHEKFWKPHQSLFQLAYEDGKDSPLSNITDILYSNKKINFTWLKVKDRKENHIRTGTLKAVYAHDGFVRWCAELDHDRILSYGEDSKICLWTIQGEKLRVLGSFGDNRYLKATVKRLFNGSFLVYNFLADHIQYDYRFVNDDIDALKLAKEYNSIDNTIYIFDRDGGSKLRLESDVPINNVVIVNNDLFIVFYQNFEIICWDNSGEKVAYFKRFNKKTNYENIHALYIGNDKKLELAHLNDFDLDNINNLQLYVMDEKNNLSNDMNLVKKINSLRTDDKSEKLSCDHRVKDGYVGYEPDDFENYEHCLTDHMQLSNGLMLNFGTDGIIYWKDPAFKETITSSSSSLEDLIRGTITSDSSSLDLFADTESSSDINIKNKSNLISTGLVDDLNGSTSSRYSQKSGVEIIVFNDIEKKILKKIEETGDRCEEIKTIKCGNYITTEERIEDEEFYYEESVVTLWDAKGDVLLSLPCCYAYQEIDSGLIEIFGNDSMFLIREDGTILSELPANYGGSFILSNGDWLGYSYYEYDNQVKAHQSNMPNYSIMCIVGDTLQTEFRVENRINQVIQINTNLLIVDVAKGILGEKNVVVLIHLDKVEDKLCDLNNIAHGWMSYTGRIGELEDLYIIYTDDQASIIDADGQQTNLYMPNIQEIVLHEDGQYLSRSKENLISLWNDQEKLQLSGYLLGDNSLSAYMIE